MGNTLSTINDAASTVSDAAITAYNSETAQTITNTVSNTMSTISDTTITAMNSETAKTITNTVSNTVSTAMNSETASNITNTASNTFSHPWASISSISNAAYTVIRSEKTKKIYNAVSTSCNVIGEVKKISNSIDWSVMSRATLKEDNLTSDLEQKRVPMTSLLKSQKIDGKNTDRRVRAKSNVYGETKAINNIGLITSKFGKFIGCGTGTIIYNQCGKSYALTAAENVVCIDKDKVKYPESIWFEIRQNTNNNKSILKSRYCASAYYIYRKRYVTCAGNFFPSDIDDNIAIIEIIDRNDELRKIEPLNLRSFKSDINHLKAQIIGYPDQPSLRGQLYGIECECKVEDNNKFITYNGIDVSGGQCGSPIFNVEEIKSNDDDLFTKFNRIIGVHISGGNQKNRGILLSDDLLPWIASVIGDECVEEPNYPCSALLITSSKEKYHVGLNMVHAKFQKTEVINTKKIYYNYDDKDDKKNHVISKKNMLSCIENMFNDKYERQSYIIYYCGDSDKDGNWIINQNKDVITFDDIYELIQSYKSAQRGRCFIISDSTYSGKWIPKTRHLYDDEIYVQASGLPFDRFFKSECDPGVFTVEYINACLSWKVQSPSNANLGVTIAAEVGGVLNGYVGTLGQHFVNLKFKKSCPSNNGNKIEDDELSNQEMLATTNDGKSDVYLNLFDDWTKMNYFKASFSYTAIAGGKGLY